MPGIFLRLYIHLTQLRLQTLHSDIIISYKFRKEECYEDSVESDIKML